MEKKKLFPIFLADDYYAKYINLIFNEIKDYIDMSAIKILTRARINPLMNKFGWASSVNIDSAVR